AALTAVGNATTEGIMSFSQNGARVLFTGYRKDVGGANPSGDAPTTTPRVIGVFDPSTGVFDTTSYAVTNAGGTIRAATSTDGSSLFYIASSSANFVAYIGSPGPSSSGVQIDARNSRQVLLKDNVLYASNGSTAIAAKFQSYGVLPTGATPPTALITLTTSDVTHGFQLFDLNTSIPGHDTLYIVNSFNNRLLKYSFDGTTWNANGFLSITGLGQGNVDGIVESGGVRLFISTGSVLGTLLDTSGHGGTITGSFSTIASAAANTAFRGLVVTVPEPGTWAMLGLGLSALFLLRRKS
ncbi:MAG: PEP-CTERM sorting domain-containing protein, partial [Verrucomicrobiales bacterium]|nr:PEP-CTERM sorting domain-containing protein [Verrucomicrobiales bacterium]